MNKFSCSLSCTWVTIIDCLFYASGSVSVEMFYWSILVVAWLYIDCFAPHYCHMQNTIREWDVVP